MEGQLEATEVAQLDRLGAADGPSSRHGLLKAEPGEGNSKNPAKKDEVAASTASPEENSQGPTPVTVTLAVSQPSKSAQRGRSINTLTLNTISSNQKISNQIRKSAQYTHNAQPRLSLSK